MREIKMKLIACAVVVNQPLLLKIVSCSKTAFTHRESNFTDTESYLDGYAHTYTDTRAAHKGRNETHLPIKRNPWLTATIRYEYKQSKRPSNIRLSIGLMSNLEQFY